MPRSPIRIFAAVIGLLFALTALPLHGATTLTLATPASITATGGGVDVDASGLTGEARLSLLALNTAGTNPTLAVKLQGSAPWAVGAVYTTTGTNDIVLRNNTNDNIRLAAKWTQSGARQIKRVGLMLKKNGTITSGKIVTLELQTNSTADPSGTAVGASVSVQTDAIGTAYDWVVFEFPKPIDVADSTVYWLVLTGDYDVSSTNNITWRTTTVASGGNANVYDSAWSAVATNSREFYLHEYNFADVSGATYSTLSTAGNATVQTLSRYAPSLPPVLRLYFTVGGTSNPAFTVGAVLNAERRQEQ